MTSILLCLTLNVVLSLSALSQPWRDYPDEKPPKMTLEEENASMKSQMRGFMIGGIVAFVIYQKTKEGFFTAICGGGAFLATVLWGGYAGIVVGILIIYFNLRAHRN